MINMNNCLYIHIKQSTVLYKLNIVVEYVCMQHSMRIYIELSIAWCVYMYCNIIIHISINFLLLYMSMLLHW